MDIILMPLVGFDRKGNRLGMGGGYYDRTLAFINEQQTPYQKLPLLVGVAHSLQEQKHIPAEEWDIRLNSIVTNKESISL